MPQEFVQSVIVGDHVAMREDDAGAPPRPALMRALRLACILAAALALAACDKCGNFLPLSQDQSAACHSDPPPQ